MGNLAVLLGSSTGPRRHRRGERAGLGRLRRRRGRRRQAPERAGRRPVRGEAPHRGLPRRCSTPAWWSASRTSAGPASPAPPARRPPGAAWAWTSTSPPCPVREPGMEPFEIMTSRSPRSGCWPSSSPATSTRCWPSAPRGRCGASVDRARVTGGGPLRILDGWDGEVLADVPAASLHDDAPLYDRPAGAGRPGRRDRRPPTSVPVARRLRRRPARPADRHLLGVPPVRPPALPQHRGGPGRRRHGAAPQAPHHRRGHRPGPGADHATATTGGARSTPGRARPWSWPRPC